MGSITVPVATQPLAAKMLEPQLLKKIMKQYTSELPNHLQGITFSVFNNKGETLFSEASGTQTLEPTSRALTTNTPIWTSSLTKLLTTLACMIAVDQELIGLDDNVRDIVPELRDVELLVGFEDSTERPRKPVLEKITEPITLRQLLSHTSGFTYDVFDEGLMEWSRGLGRPPSSHSGSIKGYIHPLIHKPGSGWAYGPGMDWAGRTIEVLTNQSLDEFMKINIFSKLGMRDTTFRPELDPSYLSLKQEHATRNPTTQALMPGGGHHLLALPAEDCIGGMGIYSTPSDLLKVLKELLTDGEAIVKRKSVAELLKPQLTPVMQSAFMEVIDGKAKYHLRQTWPEGEEGTFGLSASINLNNFPGRRLKNSMNWAGSSGLHVWIDPSTGIGALLTTQLAPPGDKMFTQCLLDLESELYSQIRTGS